jgi:tRNA-dihydrouridine synthase A
MLTQWDKALGHQSSVLSHDIVEAQMVDYMVKQSALGVPWFAVSRHILGLRHGQAGARKWRQVWSDHRLKQLPAVEVAKLANQALLPTRSAAFHFDQKVV